LFLDGNFKPEDYQVLFYLKMAGKEEITMENIE
jgi:hypothetical protein